MKIVLDVSLDREPKENDAIVYRDGKWRAVPREAFLAPQAGKHRADFAELKADLARLEASLAKLQGDFVSLAKIVKEK